MRPKLPRGQTFHSAKRWIMRPVMFIRQKLLKHYYRDDYMDIIVFFIVFDFITSISCGFRQLKWIPWLLYQSKFRNFKEN